MAEAMQTDDSESTSKRSEKPSVCPNLLVAAIDFGTAYSGYAYASHKDFIENPPRIRIPEWDKFQELRSLKTPTSILFDKDKKCVAFGYEAERKFTEMSEEDEHKEHYYFEKFKMLLYNSEIKMNQKLTKHTELSDINGKKMKAIDVFSAAIMCLKEHLENELKKTDVSQEEEDNIRWVLTLPAIWGDDAKQFMRDAAVEAGINNECLTIALEPEAASMYCKKQPLVHSKKEIHPFDPGSQYLIMDAGGGTVDVTIHTILKNGKIEEVGCASGGAWGGTYLDKKFLEMFEDILGKEVFEKYKKENLADYISISKTLELGKRNFSKSSTHLEIKIPESMIMLCKSLNTNMTDLIKKSEFQGHVKCNRSKLTLSFECVDNLFAKVCDGIVDHIRKLLQRHHEQKIKTVLMVGGFSESQYLQDIMKDAFPKIEMVTPNNAGLAVLKGAVLYGHDPKAIVSRIARFSYGVSSLIRFKESEHSPEKFKIVDDVEYCTDLFSKHITKGEKLNIDEAQASQTYSPVSKAQNSIRFCVYKSEDEDPKYIDDYGCRFVGHFDVAIPDSTDGADREVLVSFIHGNTELKVEAKNLKTNKVTKEKFTFDENVDDGKQYACQGR